MKNETNAPVKQFHEYNYDAKSVSKKEVLHHLKQLKSQLGKEMRSPIVGGLYAQGIETAMKMIDVKIKKVKEQ